MAKAYGAAIEGIFKAAARSMKASDGATAKAAGKNVDEAAEAARRSRRTDRGDGRDADGRFTGRGGYGNEYQAEGLQDFTARTGRTVDAEEVPATVNGAGHGRRYDGISQNPDGTYTAIEVKGGSATRTPNQRTFDEQVSPENPAIAIINGQEIKITSVEVVNVG